MAKSRQTGDLVSQNNLFVDNANNRIGIGTTNPVSPLTVYGNVNVITPVSGMTVSLGSSLSVSGQESEPRDLFVSPDLRRIFVLGNNGNDITQYELQSYSDKFYSDSFLDAFETDAPFSVADYMITPLGLSFSSDGTQMYVCGYPIPQEVNGANLGIGSTGIIQYILNTPWDISSGRSPSYVFKTPILDTDRVFALGSETTSPHGIEFSSDGKYFYIISLAPNIEIIQYETDIPWYVGGSTLFGRFSISAQETAAQGMSFSRDGLYFLLTGSSGDDINLYSLSTPWDITTSSFVRVVRTLGSGVFGMTAPSGIYWSADLSKIYVSDYTTDKIWYFTTDITPNNLEIAGRSNLHGDTFIDGKLEVGYANVTNNLEVGKITFSGSCNIQSNQSDTYLNSYWPGTGNPNYAGSGNIAIGAQLSALESVTDGYDNTAIGSGSGYLLTTGNENVFIGYFAGYNATTGGNNIAIGKYAGTTDADTSGLVNLTTGSNRIVIGNEAISNFYTKMAAKAHAFTTVKWNSTTFEMAADTSSERFKTNIRPFLGGVDEVLKINSVRYKPIEEPDAPDQVGLIAEQLDEVGLNEFVVYDADNLPFSISYDRMIPLLVNAIKELKMEKDELKMRIANLESVAGISSNAID